MNAVVSPQGGQQPRSKDPKVKVVRDFGGVNLQAIRQSIGDEEFAWLENAQPIGAGNLRITKPAGSTLQTLTGNPVSVWAMNIAGVDYDFVVLASGHIYRVKKTTPYTSTQITAVSGAIFNSGQTALAQWNSSIVLIVDPTAGYWYWDGANLIAISNTLASVAVTDPGVYAGTPPTVSFSGGGGSGAAGTVYMGIITVTINAAGTLYTVGDILHVNAGGFTIGGNGPRVKVTTVSAGGVITGLSVDNSGTILGAVGTTNLTTSGGTGNGATVDVTFGVTAVVVASIGSGYTSAPGVVFTGGAPTRTAVATATVSGSLNGTSIATYAGRAWIASGRTVSFTDVASYTSFAGAGGAFTIDDETLHGNITNLFVANSFLYIFGDDSIDILGDVQVTSGITSFTRQNVEASVGTTLGSSIFAFYRSLYFANTSGFYSLAGSTPQKLSDKLDRLFPYIDFTKPVTGGQVMINNILCPAFMFTFTDVLSGQGIGATRPLIAILAKGQWFFATPTSTAKLMSNTPIGGVATLFLWSYDGATTASFAQMFGGTGTATVTIVTKLWDGDQPMFDKQATRLGVGINWNSQSNSGASLNVDVDTEFSSLITKIISGADMPTTSSYTLTVSPAQSGSAKYFGFSVTGFVREVIFSLFALEYVEGKLF